jgi:hypothetical protein
MKINDSLCKKLSPIISSYYFYVTIGIATIIILNMEYFMLNGISILHLLKKARGCCMHVFLVNICSLE